MLLDNIALKYGTDKSTEDHGYTLVYEKVLSPIKNEELNILEIGVDKGYSAKMWLEYFPNATFYGMDYFKDKYFKDQSTIENVKKSLESDRCKIFQGDQTSKDDLQKIVDASGGFDLIIDDGSHVNEDHQFTLGFLFPYLNEKGIYFIEDLKCKRKPNPNFPRARNTVDVMRQLINSKEYISNVSSTEANKYITDNVSYCQLFCNDRLSIIKKK